MAEKSLGCSRIDRPFHQGACCETLADDGAYMMDNNVTFSKEVLEYAINEEAPRVFASASAVHGLNGPGHITPTLEHEKPLNIYGFSKLVFSLRSRSHGRRIQACYGGESAIF